jgi:predicted transcriptional regulator
MEYRDKILEMLKKRKTLTFEEIADDLMLDHDKFMKLITSMQDDKLLTINDKKETISQIKKP